MTAAPPGGTRRKRLKEQAHQGRRLKTRQALPAQLRRRRTGGRGRSTLNRRRRAIRRIRRRRTRRRLCDSTPPAETRTTPGRTAPSPPEPPPAHRTPPCTRGRVWPDRKACQDRRQIPREARMPVCRQWGQTRNTSPTCP